MVHPVPGQDSEHAGKTFLRTVGKYLPENTASRPRRQQCSIVNSWRRVKASFLFLICIFSLQYNLNLWLFHYFVFLKFIPCGQIVRVTDKENLKLHPTQLNSWIRTQRYTSEYELETHRK